MPISCEDFMTNSLISPESRFISYLKNKQNFTILFFWLFWIPWLPPPFEVAHLVKLTSHLGRRYHNSLSCRLQFYLGQYHAHIEWCWLSRLADLWLSRFSCHSSARGLRGVACAWADFPAWGMMSGCHVFQRVLRKICHSAGVLCAHTRGLGPQQRPVCYS